MAIGELTDEFVDRFAAESPDPDAFRAKVQAFRALDKSDRLTGAIDKEGFDTGRTAINPFTYAVDGFKSLLLKNTGFAAVGLDILFLLGFSVVAMAAATKLFRRTL